MAWTADDIKEFEKNILKPTDTFEFSCNMCGNCCRKLPEPIILSGLDVFRIAQALGVTPQQVLEEKTTFTIGSNSHIPLHTLKERLDGSCKLLRKGKCMVYTHKPVACAIFPLCRMYNTQTQEVQYFRNPHGCHTGSKGGKIWTLQEWLDEFKIGDWDEASMAWFRMVVGVTRVMSKIPRDKLPEKMIRVAGACFYTNYDITKPYLPQAQGNMEHLEFMFDEMFGKKIEYPQ